MATDRFINWFEHASRSIASKYPQVSGCAHLVTERMAGLLLENLPRELSRPMINLLPPNLGEHSWPLHARARAKRAHKVEYKDFLQRARTALACAELNLPPAAMNELAQGVSDVFLWTICQELPAELKGRISLTLSDSLRSRMDLFCAASDESLVA